MAVKLIEIFDQHGVAWKSGGSHHHVRKNWIGVDCPRCSPGSGKYRLGFEADGRRANCWVCGRVNAVEMIMRLCRTTERDAARLWNSRELRGWAPPPANDKWRAKQLKIPNGVGELLPQHRRYLQDRGFDADSVARLWGVQGIGLAAQLAWRLYIPIYDRWGRQVSWTTRSLAPHAERRYISASPQDELESLKSVLYGAHLCRSVIVVVEGPIDAWAVGPGAAATLGLGATSQQISRLAEYPVRIVCFDNEPDAQHRASALCCQLRAQAGVTENVVLESGKDPADADPAEIAELRSLYLD